MTLYTYRCPECGDIEQFREKNDLEVCPHCKSLVTKVFGGIFSLKGTGFYSTDTKYPLPE